VLSFGTESTLPFYDPDYQDERNKEDYQQLTKTCYVICKLLFSQRGRICECSKILSNVDSSNHQKAAYNGRHCCSVRTAIRM
jgi:hypothetical protein